MDINTMAHRWCNLDFGKNGDGFRNSTSHFHCTETYFYSYSTVYAQWLCKEDGKLLMVMMDKGASVTSSKHLYALHSAVPKNKVRCIETHISGGGYSYNNVRFGSFWPTALPKTLLVNLNNEVREFKTSKKLYENERFRVISNIIADVNYLFNEREECDYDHFVELYGRNEDIMKALKAVRSKKSNNISYVVDAICGKGTWNKYQERIASQKKAKRTRDFVNWFIKTHNIKADHFSRKQIDNMPIDEKVVRACLPKPEKWEIERRNWGWKREMDKKLSMYVLGYECHEVAYGFDVDDSVTNLFTKQVYSFWNLYSGGWYNHPRYNTPEWNFASSAFCSRYYKKPIFCVRAYKKSADKKNYIKRFYQICEIIEQRLLALKLWWNAQGNDNAVATMTEEQLAMYNRVQLQYIKYLDDEEARKKADEERKRLAAEEEERLKKERKEKYDAYVSMGIEGCRKLYWEKLAGICEFRNYGSELFYGGNVLLRWKNDQIIETSKGICFTIEQAKQYWKHIKAWHDNPKKFTHYTFKTKSGQYVADKYEKDILYSGCHEIAYCEMERMYNEIIKRETA